MPEMCAPSKNTTSFQSLLVKLGGIVQLVFNFGDYQTQVDLCVYMLVAVSLIASSNNDELEFEAKVLTLFEE